MFSKNFFWAKTSAALFLSFAETVENIAKEAIKARVWLTWKSRGYPITGVRFENVQIEHL